MTENAGALEWEKSCNLVRSLARCWRAGRRYGGIGPGAAGQMDATVVVIDAVNNNLGPNFRNFSTQPSRTSGASRYALTRQA